MQDDQPGDQDEPRPLQFTLQTLLIVVTLVAVACSMVAWGRLVGVFIFAAAAGTFAGLALCRVLGFNAAFGDVRRDLVKCFVLGSVITSFTCWLILQDFVIVALISVVVSAGFLVRLLWASLGMPEVIAITLFSLIGLWLAAVAILLVVGG